MRYSALATAAFAATALAGPVVNKRDYVTDITYVTVTVYVTPGQEPTPYPTHKETPAPYVAPKPAKETPKYTPVYKPQTSKPVYVAPKPQPSKEAAKPASNPTPPASSDYQGTVLYHHNVHRANHSASDLAWDDGLASAAHSWASGCVFQHHVDGYGQNLAASAPNANVSAQISDGWYNGEASNYNPYYGQASPAWSDATFEKLGHFSQMVWKGTTHVGCATVDCRGSSLGMWYTVCNYHPAGNYGGQYGANVGRPLGHPECHWDN